MKPTSHPQEAWGNPSIGCFMADGTCDADQPSILPTSGFHWSFWSVSPILRVSK